MKQLKKLFPVLTVIMLLTSCSKKKDDTPAPQATLSKNLVKYTNAYESYPLEVTTITYDAGGKMKTFTDDNDIYIFDYSNPSMLMATRKNANDGAVNMLFECPLNSNGTISKIQLKNPVTGSVDYTYEYSYNAEGYLVGLKGYNNTSSFESIIVVVNGNRVSAKHFTNGTLSQNHQFTPDLTLEVKGATGSRGYWPSKTWFGKALKNHIKELKTFKVDGTLYWHEKHKNTVDANGYLVKAEIEYPLDNTKAVRQYTFE
jgi:hypothetical protein